VAVIQKMAPLSVATIRNILLSFEYIWKEKLWLFRSFYLRRSSTENLVERDCLIRISFQVYFDFV
jgi:hypothetical protein